MIELTKAERDQIDTALLLRIHDERKFLRSLQAASTPNAERTILIEQAEREISACESARHKMIEATS